MPRNIRWDESVKENALNLVDALLYLYEQQSDDLAKPALYVEWKENRLRVTGFEIKHTGKRERTVEVGTKKEDLEKHVKKAGKSLKLSKQKGESGSSQRERELEEVQTALDCLKELGVRQDEKSAKNQGYWKFTLTLKHQTATREENLEVVKQKWKEHPKTNSPVTSSTTPILETEKSIDWHNICRTRLEKQKRLTTNRLMQADEMLFDINQICVDLALVERKQPDKRTGDDNPQQSQLYKPDYEETQKLEYEEFLATVLKASQSNKIAIIGEPGAGKTTLLQRIAFWILNNTDGLPIWIPLGNLPTPAPKLKEYLLNNWLEDAFSNVTPKIRAEFEGLLTAGRVWLLLDGVDEMVANSGNPLSLIDNWIPGWCQQLSVVLTCRLNVWEANPHALNGFQTYRTLEFSQEKVIEFIEGCFQESNPALGTQLQQALNQPGKERIKDLIRNPLRLTLLCSTWHLREGKLPDTKAELYQQYVEEVYRWKKDEFPTTPEQRKQLNAKLKELALEAIDKEENRFCLRHKFVEGILGDSEALLRSADRDGCVFQLALNIGWLNRVGVDAKNPNPNQPVYAFFHPTFQEYFAALAVDDWDFFLPRAHDNQNPKPVSERYRIFEPQWKEAILLWLGREEVEREEFIEALIEFEDGCKDFYGFRASFLAATGIAEFTNCSKADGIVAQIIKWSFDYFSTENQEWVIFAEPIAQRARATLLQTDCDRATNELIDLLETTEDEDICWRVADSLGKINSGNEQAIAELVRILETTEDEDTRWRAADSLEKIGIGNEQAITELVRILETTEDEWTRTRAAHCLGEIGSGNEQVVAELVRILKTTDNKDTRWYAAYGLGKIGNGNVPAVTTLKWVLETAEDEDIRWRAAYSLGKIDSGNEQAIAELVRILEMTEEEHTRWIVAYSLREIGSGHEQAIAELIRIAETSDNEWMRARATDSLEKIGSGNEQAITELVQILEMSGNEWTRWRAANSLEKIGSGNEQAITELIRILKAPNNESTRGDAAYILEEILLNAQMPSVISALQHCLANEVYESDPDLFSNCYNLIWHCAQNMTYPAFYQAWHQQEEVEKTTTPDSQSLKQADLPQSLQSAIANDPQLSQIIHLICIDGSNFIDPDNPAVEIYDQMLDQNCPECDKVPETMPALKLYWNFLKRKSEKHPVLVFYASSTNPYSEAFFKDLSKFGKAICVVTSPPTPLLRSLLPRRGGEGSKSSSGSPSSPWGEGVRGWGSVQFFTPSHAIAKRCCVSEARRASVSAQIADVVEWIQAMVEQK